MAARGTITRLIRSHDHIYILRDDGYELFFLREKLRGTHYELLRERRHVEFEVSRKTGRAREVKVRLTGKKG